MWWFKFSALLLVILAASLTACGFQPVYGTHTNTNTPAVSEELKAIQVATIPDRSGQILRNVIIDRLQGSSGTTFTRYWLEVSVQSTYMPLAIRKDATATRTRLTMDAHYTLREIATGKIVFQDTSHTVTSYNVLESQYGSMVNAQDANRRALEDLAQDITNRLALHFKYPS